MALSTSTNGSVSGQINTQSPQASAGSGSPPTAAARNIQPGTATSLLAGPGSGSDGIPLSSTILPVANLDTSTQSVSQTQQSAVKSPQHHINAVLLAVVIILFVLAILAFWQTNRSAKNTTNY